MTFYITSNLPTEPIIDQFMSFSCKKDSQSEQPVALFEDFNEETKKKMILYYSESKDPILSIIFRHPSEENNLVEKTFNLIFTELLELRSGSLQNELLKKGYVISIFYDIQKKASNVIASLHLVLTENGHNQHDDVTNICFKYLKKLNIQRIQIKRHEDVDSYIYKYGSSDLFYEDIHSDIQHLPVNIKANDVMPYLYLKSKTDFNKLKEVYERINKYSNWRILMTKSENFTNVTSGITKIKYALEKVQR